MDYIRTILIFLHLMVFAFAITTLYKSDFHLFMERPKNEEIKSMGNKMLIYFVVLWITGLGVIYVDTAFDMDKILSAQKLLAKLSCVMVLTFNGLVIHLLVFRKLAQETLDKTDMLVMSISGAVSTASWTFAGFLGIAKPLAKHLTLENFISLYALVIAIASLGAIALAPIISRNWQSESHLPA